VGFDVFNTLLVRRVLPDVVKELVARDLAARLERLGCGRSWQTLLEDRHRIERELCLHNQATGLDDEFEYERMLALWVAGCGVGDDVAPTLVAALGNHERRIELLAQAPAPHAADALAALEADGKRLIFVSDFYLATDVLWDFLRASGLGAPFAAGYSSGDVLLRKASGRLFGRVLEAEGLRPDQLLFVGDNLHADHVRPRALGIRTLLVRDPQEAKRTVVLETLARGAAKNRFWRGAAMLETLTTLPHRGRRPGTDAERLGATLAPAYCVFSEYILQKAREEGATAIYFCAREGRLFHRMVRTLARRVSADRPLPALHYLHVSRRATFLPALGGLEPHDLEPFFRQYGRSSMRTFLWNLSLPVEEFGPLAQRAGFPDLDAEFADFPHQQAFHRFCLDAEVRAAFARHQARSRDLLARYLAARGFFAHRRVLFVDIGWKGSIIDNVLLAMRERPDRPEALALLFGCLEDARQDVVRKYGYFFHGPDRDLLAEAPLMNVPLFEMHATENQGTTIAYEEDETGAVQPVLDHHPAEKDTYDRFMAEGRRAIRAVFASYVRYRPLLDAHQEGGVTDWRPFLRDALRRVVVYPTRGEVRSFMRTSHHESFGRPEIRHWGDEGLDLRSALSRSPRRTAKELYLRVRCAVWPAGMLRRMGLGATQIGYDLSDVWFRTHRW
jgi:FMN phosphatase YigB (HAD superfamily)